MISHKHKCIFIHIPRTGGTFIEKLIFGRDWWGEDHKTKHILASQAKKIYKKYWNDYFKFSFVRNPYTRSKSMLYHSEVYYGKKNLNYIDEECLNFYKKNFNYPITLETDYRYYNLKDFQSKKHKTNQVYLNILDEKIDFIGKFENYDEHLNFVCDKIGLNFFKLRKIFTRKVSQSTELKNYSILKKKKLSQNIKNKIYEIYKNDFINFDYKK